MSIREIFYLTAFTVLVGWILSVGKTVILPFVVAVMLTYVLIGATHGLRRLPLMSALPVWLHYVLALLIFALALAAITLVAVSNLRAIAQSQLAHEDEMLLLLTRFLEPLHLTDAPTWESLRTQLVDRLDLPRLSLGLLGALASAGGYAVLMMTYMAFMVAERGPLSRKVSLVIPDSGERDAALALFRRINTQVVTYLSTKTLMNVILGTISWILMWMLGIENSVFWAFLIALFNYIPYVGSIAGVALASAYTAFAYGDLKLAGLALVVLSLAQFYVGNLLEPRVMGRTLNLSPLTVLLALVVWSTLWGVPGAIIAVPMTSILMIILSAFKRTRPVAILTSRDGNLLH